MVIAVIVFTAISVAGLGTTVAVSRDPHRSIPLAPLIVGIVSAFVALGILSQM